MSTEPTWRVYLREWLAVYSCEGDSPECWDHFAAKYAGRVRDEDRRVRVTDTGQRLELSLWNRRGEFKDSEDAKMLALDLEVGWHGPHLDSGPCRVVQRGSDEEKELLAYGKKKLPDAG